MAKLKNVESEVYEDSKTFGDIRYDYTVQKQLMRVAEVSSAPISKPMLENFRNCARTLHNLLAPYENKEFKEVYEQLKKTIEKEPRMVGDLEKLHSALMEYHRALMMLLDETGFLNERDGSEQV